MRASLASPRERGQVCPVQCGKLAGGMDLSRVLSYLVSEAAMNAANQMLGADDWGQRLKV